MENSAVQRVFHITELTEHILSFVPSEQLVTAIRVCRAWHDLGSTPTLGTLLFLRTKNPLPRTLSDFPYLGVPYEDRPRTPSSQFLVAAGFPNTCSVYRGLLTYYPASNHTTDAEPAVNGILFQSSRAFDTPNSTTSHHAAQKELDTVHSKMSRKARTQRVLPPGLAEGHITRAMFLSQPAETATLLDIRVIVDCEGVYRDGSTLRKSVMLTSLCVRDAGGVKLGQILEVVEKVVRQVAGSLGLIDTRAEFGWGTRLVADSVGKRVTVAVRGL